MLVATLDEAVELLYGLERESFVSERDGLVKELRKAKERELANDVKALRKPSAVAAEVNRVVRSDPSGVELILQAAELLRAAQSGALNDSLNVSDLQTQYREAIKALAQKAQSHRAEVRSALEAATIDVESNEALRTGSLVTVPTPVSVFGLAPTVPADELAARRAKREQAAASANAEKARVAAEKEAEKARVAEAAEKEAEKARVAEEKEAEKARVAEEAEKARVAEEKARVAEAAEKEAEKARVAEEKEAAKQRKQRLKELATQHREALRAQLAALDDEADAVGKAEDMAAVVDDLSAEIVEQEASLTELRQRREAAVESSQTTLDAKAVAAERAREAEEAVLALAAAIEAIEAIEANEANEEA